MKRRAFLSLMGAAPLAARAAADAEIAKNIGLAASGTGNAGALVGGSVSTLGMQASGSYVPYEERLTKTVEFIKKFGLPDVVEREMRDRARFVSSLDPDLACKATWSMSVKLMTQRQRNFERGVEQLKNSDGQMKGRLSLTKLLGFDWPF